MYLRILDFTKLHSLLGALKRFLVLPLLFGVSLFAARAYFPAQLYTEALKAANERMTIVIDAGHGGEDCGAIGVSGIYEKDINLAVAYELGRILSDNGFAVVYTRTEDKLLYKDDENIKGLRKISDLKNRCKIVADYPNALFVSIHMNSYADSKYSGLQVYYSGNNEQSYALAASIQSTVREALQASNNRKVKLGKNIYVLENTYNPSVLVECGFLTNREECEKLSQKEYQNALCLAIAQGIFRYMEKTS